MPSRNATTAWTGGLQDGSGHVTLDSSNAGQFDVSFPRRAADDAEGVTSPEELIAAAHTSCLAMNMSGVLDGAGLKADSIDVSAEVSLGADPAGGFQLTSIALTMRVAVKDLDDAKFQELAAKAAKTCPVSKALAGVPQTFEATLA
ncbi:MAG: OsmC family peroxiredoxin [Geodermatophilaceae bacterium]|nr:OsmC family peroxiredoxin [Geodermatophilaceae bacterium]